MYDVIIIGGGPGGSTTAAVLAQQGKKVLILEKELFPRFHIGESLIPYGNDILQKIGVWDKLQSAGFMPKYGAEFVTGNARRKTQVLFSQFLGKKYAQTFQVERSTFDQLLLEHAESLGCEVWQQCKATSIEDHGDHLSVRCSREGQAHELKSRWLVDASGRNSIIGKQFSIPKTDLGLPKKFATFAHFHDVKRNSAPAEGHITILRLVFGWLWIIPLDQEKTSVGLVQNLEQFKSSGMKPDECFEHVLKTTPELRRRLGNATRVSDYFYEGDYTFRHLKNADSRWLMVGDSAGFIDPIFSSGVMLALKSGHLAAQNILKADQKNRALTSQEQAQYTKAVGNMCEVFVRMIKMFYDNRSFEVFMLPNPPAIIRKAVNNLVGGNTDMGWNLKIFVWLFYAICWVQHHISIVPKIRLGEPLPTKNS